MQTKGFPSKNIPCSEKSSFRKFRDTLSASFGGFAKDFVCQSNATESTSAVCDSVCVCVCGCMCACARACACACGFVRLLLLLRWRVHFWPLLRRGAFCLLFLRCSFAAAVRERSLTDFFFSLAGAASAEHNKSRKNQNTHSRASQYRHTATSDSNAQLQEQRSQPARCTGHWELS